MGPDGQAAFCQVKKNVNGLPGEAWQEERLHVENEQGIYGNCRRSWFHGVKPWFWSILSYR